MDAAGAALRRLLLLALCCAQAAAGGKVLPPPSNLSFSFVQMCTLNWTWSAPENISRSCDLEYSSDVVIDEVPQDKREWTKSLFRVTDTFLNAEMRFKVRSECKHDNASEPSRWVETSVQPKGVPGTAATDLDCVWHNLEYMDCKWLAGKNARNCTKYILFYWYDGLKSPKKCNNYSMHEGIFECVFSLTFPKVTNTYPTLSILVKDDSEEIRPVCASKNPTTLVKPAAPKAVMLSKVNDTIHLEWSESDTFPANCLYYEVEYRSDDMDTPRTIKRYPRRLFCGQNLINIDMTTGRGELSINHRCLEKNKKVAYNHTSVPSVDPNTKYTFRVRAKPKSECYSSKLCSNWSKEKSIGEKPDSTFYFVLMITIPLIVAVSTIILLFYLKRLKILILPPIPDPREILKRMFGEQNEDSQSGAKDASVNAYNRLIKEEEIHSLVLTETLECSYSENENR